MKTYLVRALHYFTKIAVIIALALAVLYFMGQLDVALMGTWRMGLLIMLLVVLAAVYPAMSFGSTIIRADFATERGALEKAMKNLGYVVDKSDAGCIEFRAESMTRRLWNQMDDRITACEQGDRIRISGMRKELARVESHFMAVRGQ